MDHDLPTTPETSPTKNVSSEQSEASLPTSPPLDSDLIQTKEEMQAQIILEQSIQIDQYRGILTYIARRTIDEWVREQAENALVEIPKGA